MDRSSLLSLFIVSNLVNVALSAPTDSPNLDLSSSTQILFIATTEYSTTASIADEILEERHAGDLNNSTSDVWATTAAGPEEETSVFYEARSDGQSEPHYSAGSSTTTVAEASGPPFIFMDETKSTDEWRTSFQPRAGAATESIVIESTTPSGTADDESMGFSTTPLEGLINATTISTLDLSTLASFVHSQYVEHPNNSNNVSIDSRNDPKHPSICIHNGKRYFSGETLEQTDPCNFCLCINGYVDCYWKNCPPAPEGCVILDFEGVCQRSLYLCPIPKKGQPLPFLINSIATIAPYKAAKDVGIPPDQKLTCDILGVEYKVGELVGVASDPCLECRCALDSLYCSPKCCFQPAEPQQDASKTSRADDAQHWQPVLANPLRHLRTEFEEGKRRRRRR